ncbi:unnamed protein product [Spirodela intermedia]|uniref:Uncharacterized protein n=1 Tax=Spirodela intermedia TaxID=51605 RepID=A0A7I8JFL9_SPIIN|nr:unnamed protein product [Spirodela intermedia]CAA6668944.1 unnamed protein product [Spirodela intermedia]
MWQGRRAQLWLEKLGITEPFSGNAATQWKKLKSELALKQYMIITRNNIRLLDFKVYKEGSHGDDWLAASPYGMVADGSVSSEGGNMVGALPWAQVPVFYMPQAQGLMEILDRDWLDLYCWTPNGSSLFRVPRDQEYWCLLKTALADFWWKHVHPARQILSVAPTESSMEELKLLRPVARHELFNSIACASRHLVRRCALMRMHLNQMPRSRLRS